MDVLNKRLNVSNDDKIKAGLFFLSLSVLSLKHGDYALISDQSNAGTACL